MTDVTTPADDFVIKLADLLDLPPDQLHDDYQLEGDQWDSLVHLSVIALVDEMYGVAVPTNELIGCRTLKDVVDLVAQYR